MWLLTSFGFFSIVQKPGDVSEDMLTIRSRVRSDLEALRAMLPELGPISESKSTDYRFRARAPKAAVAAAVSKAVQELTYSNFKNAVGERQGKKRAKMYQGVWNVLYALQTDPEYEVTALGPALATPKPPFPVRPSTVADVGREEFAIPQADAYGGVLVSAKGKVLLREPAGHFGGYVWTFAKGRPDPGETPSQAALREVKEETGYDARILAPIAKVFGGTTSTTALYLMEAVGEPDTPTPETNQIRWVTADEARELIAETKSKTGRERDLAILESAIELLGTLGPEAQPAARRDDWQALPLPAAVKPLAVELRYSDAEMSLIRKGYVPSFMEEKWFAWCDGDTLNLHRSWTGYCIFQIPFAAEGGKWRARSMIVNRDPEQYLNVDDDEDRELVEKLIAGLLLNRTQDGDDLGAFAGLAAAMQPNYLGSPEVVQGLVGKLFEVVVNKWRGEANYNDVLSTIAEITSAMTGEDESYTRMPWHSEGQLGRAIIRYLDLDADYCTGESLHMICSEGLAGVSTRISEMMDAFMRDQGAAWEEHAIPQLHQLHRFVASVFLGTNTIEFPERSLKDFPWQQVTPSSTG